MSISLSYTYCEVVDVSPLSGSIKLHFWAHMKNAVKFSLLVKFHFILKITEGIHRFLKNMSSFWVSW